MLYKILLIIYIFLTFTKSHAAQLDQKINLLCHEAERWIGIEEEGENKSQLIKIFQCAVDNRAQEEPWCMSFMQYCIKMTEETLNALFPHDSFIKSRIYRSEHCLTTWNKSPELQSANPTRGSLCIWQRHDDNGPSLSGHTGLVVQFYPGAVWIVEGNTASLKQTANSHDGVYLKKYNLDQLDHDSLVCKGFLKVWDK
jgi:hypothetical protein